ncbi:acylphosphatase-1 isoform X2 [Cryptotermes secundus]|uniref:acylphosphatase-1 isoform X2 n=1 Tax=Cryptotermes secundus TaxID=105785 RepID=UPI000CD7D9BC|nr:acylphosphatase-1 isoform X2 [Cryptotermes secundus]
MSYQYSVFFRKHTVEKGRQLGIRGWCMNTHRGTVLGKVEGEPVKVKEMKRWLKETGSPHSRIEKAEFRNEKFIDSYSFSDFKVHH